MRNIKKRYSRNRYQNSPIIVIVIKNNNHFKFMEKVKKKSFATIDSLTSFGTIFLIIEIIVLLLFAIFVRMPINIPNDVLSL